MNTDKIFYTETEIVGGSGVCYESRPEAGGVRMGLGKIRGLPFSLKTGILWQMKLRTELLEHLTDQDILEEVLANNHRYKPEPLFSKTGLGSLSPATPEERAQEEARSTARIQSAMQRLKRSGAAGKPKSAPSPKR